MKNKLPQYFKTQRKRHGLSQLQMARLLGKSPRYVSKLEAGERTPTLESVLSYHFLFGIEIKNLIPDYYLKLQSSLIISIEKQPHLVTNKNIMSVIKNRLNICHLKEGINKNVNEAK